MRIYLAAMLLTTTACIWMGNAVAAEPLPYSAIVAGLLDQGVTITQADPVNEKIVVGYANVKDGFGEKPIKIVVKMSESDYEAEFDAKGWYIGFDSKSWLQALRDKIDLYLKTPENILKAESITNGQFQLTRQILSSMNSLNGERWINANLVDKPISWQASLTDFERNHSEEYSNYKYVASFVLLEDNVRITTYIRYYTNSDEWASHSAEEVINAKGIIKSVSPSPLNTNRVSYDVVEPDVLAK